MLINAMTDNCLVPVARNGVATENDGKQETDPPGYQDTSRNDGNDGEALDREQSVVENQQRQAGHCYCACEDDLDCPVVQKKLFDLIQA